MLSSAGSLCDRFNMIENAFFLSFIMQRGTLKPINEVTKVRPIEPVYSYKSYVTSNFQAFWSRPPVSTPQYTGGSWPNVALHVGLPCDAIPRSRGSRLVRARGEPSTLNSTALNLPQVHYATRYRGLGGGGWSEIEVNHQPYTLDPTALNWFG